jgi:hypothetical protein
MVGQMNSPFARELRIVAGAIATCAGAAHAQWTVISLHPAGATESRAMGVSGGQQVGYAVINGVVLASLWGGSAASWVDLSPAGATNSYAVGVSAGQQVGQATVGGVDRASLWTGTAGSWVDLNPPSSISYARAIQGGHQAGDINNTACLWSGTASSRVSLHPAGAEVSHVYAVSGARQVGNAVFNSVPHAGLWNSTAGSWVDLNPAAATSGSIAYGMDSAQQVGIAWANGNWHASLWSGTAASWVDLSPAGGGFSQVNAVDAGQQVGFAGHACLWSGTAASRVDLQAALPPGFTTSYAQGIWHDAALTYVVGYAYNTTTSRYEALMWVSPRCYPNCDASTVPPVLNVNDFICFQQRFAAADPYANCDGSTTAPALTVNDFVCFQQRFAAGCP